jgi:hypothetical protein
MNERILELAEQAEILFYKGRIPETGYEYEGAEVTKEDLEKFAELIIKECLSDLKERIALRYQGSDKDRDIGYGMEIVYMDIVEKFRVE